MGNFSYEPIIREIKGRLSIINLIETYVSLKKAGKGYVGLCPFHDDKKPSFHVNEDKGVFHCFGCGAGGDVIGFTMRYMNISFQEAVKELASKAGVKIESKSIPTHKKSDREKLLKFNSFVADFYHNMLFHKKDGNRAINYLSERGLSLEVIKEFHLGYTPQGWDTLVKFLISKNIPLKVAEKTGLIIKRKDNDGYYDRFRNRIIFPIRDVDKNVLGFGGRVIEEAADPKYINSPESDIYHKRSVFYGLDKSRDYIRRSEKAIIVEGYMDFLSLYSKGIKNVVATLGTSLTRDHASLIRRYTEKIVVVFDGDKSGVDASLRVLEVFLEVGISPLMVALPRGKDPDSYISEKGNDEFLKIVEDAKSLLDFFIERILNEFKQGSITRNRAVQRIAKIIEKIKDQIEQIHYIRKIAEVFGVRENELFSLIKHEERYYGQTDLRLSKKQYTPEKILIKILLKYPHYSRLLKDTNLVEYLVEDDLKSILEDVLQRDVIDVSALLVRFSGSPVQEIISEAIFFSDDITDETMAQKMLDDCIRKFKLRNLEDKLSSLRLEIDQARLNSDDILEEKLLKKYKEFRDLVEQEKLIKGSNL